MQLGVCYYPEHWPAERWPVDAQLMRQAGLSLVRIGEFAWQQMEPAENQFDWGWLDQAIEVLAAAGLQVVLGTPTATPPAWLCRAQPDILPVDNQGRRRRFGSRRHYCPNSAAYQEHTVRIVTAMAERYGRHTTVIGWQIDNEFGCHDTARCYCDKCAAAFRRWLQSRYQTVEAVNVAWGTAFWSQGYSDWGEIEPPMLTVTEANPSHLLDYYRFSSDAFVAYQQLQLDLLRRLTAGQFVTTNFMGNFPDLDYHDLARPLDFVTWDSYPTGFAEVQGQSLYAPGEDRPVYAYDVGDPAVTGFCHDLTRGLKPGTPFWVMEQQCGQINWSLYNTGVRPGTVRLWTWHALASGASAVVYFRWRATLYAQEQYHSGLLQHDASPATGYHDLLAMLPEREMMAEVAAEPHTAEVALLLSYDDLWAIQLQPHRRDFGYLRHLFRFYRTLQGLGVAVDIIPPDASLDGYKIVLTPTAHLGSERLAAALTSFANNGGTVLLGVRSGFKTASNRVTDGPLPGLYQEVIGATVAEWQSLPPQVSVPIESSIAGLDGPAETWLEWLQPAAGTEVLASYGSDPFTGRAALSRRRVGRGQVYYLGWYPGLAQCRAMMQLLTQQAGVESLADLPEGMLLARRGRYTLLLNFNDETRVVELNGESITLAAREVWVQERGNGPAVAPFHRKPN